MRRTLDFISGSFITKLFLIIITVIIIASAIFVYTNPNEPLSLLLNSNYLVAVITGIAGTVAFLIYFKQKNDNRRDAAKTILAEIVNSEKIIKEVNDLKKFKSFFSLEPDPMKFYLGDFSWNQYKYLFIGDFDSYEWERINLYFAQCETFNQAVKGIANLLPQNIDYRMQCLQQELAKIAMEQADELSKLEKPKDTDNDDKYQKELKRINEKYQQKAKDFTWSFVDAKDSNLIYVYTPMNAYEPLNRELDKIDTDISKSSVGKKLAKLAR